MKKTEGRYHSFSDCFINRATFSIDFTRETTPQVKTPTYEFFEGFKCYKQEIALSNLSCVFPEVFAPDYFMFTKRTQANSCALRAQVRRSTNLIKSICNLVLYVGKTNLRYFFKLCRYNVEFWRFLSPCRFQKLSSSPLKRDPHLRQLSYCFCYLVRRILCAVRNAQLVLKVICLLWCSLPPIILNLSKQGVRISW
jgi:hypothetical protein